MTAQRTDTIFINNIEHRLYALPLNQYFEKFGCPISLFGGNTALYRGYHATWLLENDTLFLTEFWGENFLLQKEYSLTDIFPKQIKVFAEWFTGDLCIPSGQKIEYWHGGLGGWKHEYNAIIKIEKGLLIATEFIDN